MLLHYLVKRGNKKLHFSLKCCISALPEFNQLLDFFNLFESRLILMLLYDSPSLVINAFSHRDCWGHGSGERKSIALQQLDCVACTRNALMRCLLGYLFCKVMQKHWTGEVGKQSII